MNKALMTFLLMKLALLSAGTGFYAIPIEAALGTVCGTVAYAGFETAKGFAFSKALSYAIESVSNKVYGWNQPLVLMAEIRKERCIVIDIPAESDTINFTFSSIQAPKKADGSGSEDNLMLHVPQELRGKKIQIDLARLAIAKQVIRLCEHVKVNQAAGYEKINNFLIYCTNKIVAKIIALMPKAQQAGGIINPNIAGGNSPCEVHAKYLRSIVYIIEACRKMVENCNHQDLSVEAKKVALRKRDGTIMRALSQVIVGNHSVDYNNSSNIKIPIFDFESHLAKYEQFKRQNNQAKLISLYAGIGAACASSYMLMKYMQPLLVQTLQCTTAGATAVKICSGLEVSAKTGMNTLLEACKGFLSLPRQHIVSLGGVQVPVTSGLRNHMVNGISALTGITISWWAMHKQSKAHMLLGGSTVSRMDQLKGFGMGMLHSVGALFSSLWLNTLVNPSAQLAAWPLWLHSHLSGHLLRPFFLNC
jgi:hypothetical protein